MATGIDKPRDGTLTAKGDLLYADPNFGSPHMSAHATSPVKGKGGEALSGPYEAVVGWPLPVQEGMKFSGVAGVHVESPDRVIVVCHFGLITKPPTEVVWGRALLSKHDGPYGDGYGPDAGATGEHHVVVFNRAGEPVESWTWNDHLFGKLNRVFIAPDDPDRHIWVTDSVKQKVFKFTNDGKKLVLEIGRSDVGSSEEAPWKGQDIAWLPNGDFYTAGLARIDRFTPDGELVWSLCKRGSGPGEFYDLHGIVLDQERHRIYVSDRGNARIQVFDEEWTFIESWENILAPYSLRLSKDGFIWIGDGFTHKLFKYDLEGHELLSWGTFGVAPGCIFGPHWFDVDEEGSLYIAEDYGDRVQKLRVRGDVDANDPRLIGQLVRF